MESRCSFVLQLVVLEPWITDPPPICFPLILVLPAEKLAMGWREVGSHGGMLLLCSTDPLLILQKPGFFLPVSGYIPYV